MTSCVPRRRIARPALSPNYTHGHHAYSHLLINLGRYDESLVESRIFVELDPLSPASSLHLGQPYVAARLWDLAITQEQKTLSIEPNFVEAHRQLAEAYLGKRMYPEAIAEMRRAFQLAPANPQSPLYKALLGNFLAQAGDTAGAKRYLAEIKPARSPCSMLSYTPDWPTRTKHLIA